MLALVSRRKVRCAYLLRSLFTASKQLVGLPFTVSFKDAAQKIDSATGFFDQKIKQEEVRINKFSEDRIRTQFIPFYAGEAEISSEYMGEYGIDVTQYYTEYERNSAGKLVAVQKSRIRTDWYPTSGVLPAMKYTPRDPNHINLQLYAGYSYSRNKVEGMLRTEEINDLQVLSPNHLMCDGKEREVCSHDMKENIAKEHIMNRIVAYENERAENDIKRKHGRSHRARVNKIVPNLDKSHVQLWRFYIPAYTCKYSKDPPLYLVVNGRTGILKGNFLYDKVKCGVAASLVLTVIAALVAAHPLQNLLFASLIGFGGGYGFAAIHNHSVLAEIQNVRKEEKKNAEFQEQQQNNKELQEKPIRSTYPAKKNQTTESPKDTKEPTKLTNPEVKRSQTPSASTIKPSKEPVPQKEVRSNAKQDTNDPSDIILEDQYCKLFNLRMGKKYSLRQLNEARDKAVRSWTPPQYTGSPAIGESMVKQINSVYNYTLKRAGRHN